MNQNVKDELAKIQKKNKGLLTAEKVVEAAADEENPLHALFDWDDASAGHKHRLMTAQGVIRSFEIVYRQVEKQTIYVDRVKAPKPRTQLPQWSPDPTKQSGYVLTEECMQKHPTALLRQEYERCLAQVRRFTPYLIMADMGAEAQMIEEAMRRTEAAIDGLGYAEAGA